MNIPYVPVTIDNAELIIQSLAQQALKDGEDLKMGLRITQRRMFNALASVATTPLYQTASNNIPNNHCCVMIGDDSRGYVLPRSYCQEPVVWKSRGKNYCEKHTPVDVAILEGNENDN
jgi:hypothetical protein